MAVSVSDRKMRVVLEKKVINAAFVDLI